MAVEIVPLEASHVDECARLLASRQQRDRSRQPYLPAAFEASENARPLVEDAMRGPHAAGVAAVRAGEVVGYLAGATSEPPATTIGAQFSPRRGFSIGYSGHAVASHADAPLYRPMYAAISERFVRAGFLDHSVSVSASDRAVEDVWRDLGFGRYHVAAVRPVEPQPQASAVVEVHRAGPEDIGVIEALDALLERHHLLPPTYLPFRWEARPAFQDFFAALLADESNAFFLAWRKGRSIGMNSMLADSFLSPMARPESCCYLLQGIVESESRRQGVGQALLANSLRWAAEQGFRYCGLHFFSPNYTGADFWLGNGFQPVEVRLTRHVDERVNWVEPRPVDPEA